MSWLEQNDMTEQISIGDLQVEKVLYDLVANDIAPGTGINADVFWSELEKILKDLMPVNKTLLVKRDEFQLKIDQWHRERATLPHNMQEYQAFLKEISPTSRFDFFEKCGHFPFLSKAYEFNKTIEDFLKGSTL